MAEVDEISQPTKWEKYGISWWCYGDFTYQWRERNGDLFMGIDDVMVIFMVIFYGI